MELKLLRSPHDIYSGKRRIYPSSFFSWLSRERSWKCVCVCVCVCISTCWEHRLKYLHNTFKLTRLRPSISFLKIDPRLTQKNPGRMKLEQMLFESSQSRVFLIFSLSTSRVIKNAASVHYHLLSPAWSWTVMKQCPCPGAKDSPLYEASDGWRRQGTRGQTRPFKNPINHQTLPGVDKP